MTAATIRQPSSLGSAFKAQLLSFKEYFTCKARRAKVLTYSDEQGKTIRRFVRAAQGAIRGFQALSDAQHVSARFLLARQAVVFLIASHVYSVEPTSENVSLIPSEAWANLSRLVPELPVFAQSSCMVLALDDAAKVHELAESNPELLVQIESTLLWLSDLVEARTPLELRWLSVRRILSLVAGIGVALVVLFAVLLGDKNLALKKPVSASTHYPGTPDPSALVDGKRDNKFGVHTTVEANPWVMIDLQGSYRVSRIKVYARIDGMIGESLPIVVEGADALGQYKEITRITQPAPEWSIPVNKLLLTKVRFSLPRQGYLAMQEVEVFGK